MTEDTDNQSISEGDAPARLKVPAVVKWPIFPFEGEMRVRKLEPYTEEERIREGDPGGDPCGCSTDELKPEPVWSNDRWRVRPIQFGNEASPFPAYMLSTQACIDIDGLDDQYASELGLLTIRLDRAIMSLGDVGRVHYNRWGDGAFHFHVWFLGRPKGAWQFSGYMLPIWGFTLPPLDPEIHARNDQLVGDHLRQSMSQE